MKVLFDHNLPHKLRTNLATLGNHEIVTASYMGWGGLRNGELLRTAEESGLDVFVTGDKSLADEQNLTGCIRDLSVRAISQINAYEEELRQSADARRNFYQRSDRLHIKTVPAEAVRIAEALRSLPGHSSLWR